MKISWILLAALAAMVAPAPKGDSARTTVTIQSLQFTPATINIHPGDVVVWTNNDDRDHTVVAGDGSFRSGNIASGASWQHVFPEAGTFPYQCSYHPRMHGVVIVAK